MSAEKPCFNATLAREGFRLVFGPIVEQVRQINLGNNQYVNP
jgi:hypothetical protein